MPRLHLDRGRGDNPVFQSSLENVLSITKHAMVLMALAGYAGTVLSAASISNANAVPQLDDKGRAAYQEFLRSQEHRAFVVAPGGVWAWSGEMGCADAAEEDARSQCQEQTTQRCITYAVNDMVVFNEGAWKGAWGPYATKAEAGRAETGVRRGQRFPDLALRDARGQALKLSDLHGKVVVLHFWGSWCPPCQREMPDLQKLHGKLAGNKGIVFVLVPLRESFADAVKWARSKRISMPLFDAGEASVKGTLALGNGGQMKDRDIAKAFPTTYVLDKHGIVLFSHYGPAARWSEYAPQLLDAAAKSGK